MEIQIKETDLKWDANGIADLNLCGLQLTIAVTQEDPTTDDTWYTIDYNDEPIGGYWESQGLADWLTEFLHNASDEYMDTMDTHKATTLNAR